MEQPLIRPGRVETRESNPTVPQVVARFRNAAQGNLVIQQLGMLGLPGDAIGVLAPERTEQGRGMILAISCPDVATVERVEAICRNQGGDMRRHRGSVESGGPSTPIAKT